jgi:hypothetical protein
MKTKYFFVAGLLTAVLFGAASSLFPSEPCRNWDMRGHWKLTGQMSTVEMQLSQGQTGGSIIGRASATGKDGEGGDVAGTLGGADLNFQIKWAKGAVSTMTGSIAPDGRIQGSWFPGAYDGTRYTWSGDRAMRCADTAPSTAAPKPAATAAAQLHATPADIVIPAGENEGKTTLTWDGAQGCSLWLSLDGQPETHVGDLSDAKGSHVFTVKPGTDRLSLKNGGREVASVTIRARVIHVTGHPKVPASAPTPVGVLPGTTADTSGQGGFPTTGSGARTPLIKANPQVVTIPAGQNEGTTVLIWDAGNDHPRAEVWLEVNGHDKKLFTGSSKGRREIMVKPGKSYLYILTDSGQLLATVNVQAGGQESMGRHPNGKKHRHQRNDDRDEN